MQESVLFDRKFRISAPIMYAIHSGVSEKLKGVEELVKTIKYFQKIKLKANDAS